VSTSREMESTSRNTARLRRWQGWFLINREVKIGQLSTGVAESFFTSLLSVHPVRVTERKCKLLIYAFFFKKLGIESH